MSKKRTDNLDPNWNANQVFQAIKSTSDLIVITDRSGNLTFANAGLLKAASQSESNLLGKPFASLLSPNNAPLLTRELIAKTSDPSDWKSECLLSRPDGGDLPSGASAEHGESRGRLATAVAERISLAIANLRLRQILRGQSIRDPLTGLFNRRYMEESLEREISRAARNQESVAVLMLDIDHFKRFNDTFGHQAADKLLQAVGDLLSQRTRGQDIACRYGGEEFALILSGASLDAARRRAELLLEDLKHLNVEHAGQTLERITMSVGVAAAQGHDADAEDLVRKADQALYRAKSEGRDCIVNA